MNKVAYYCNHKIKDTVYFLDNDVKLKGTVTGVIFKEKYIHYVIHANHCSYVLEENEIIEENK